MINNFVSESELEEARRRRQEEWEKTRRPDQPLEAPEEEHDPRSLYERLQENKIKAQEEFEESRRLKNLIRGLDDEEVSFLESVDRLKMDEEKQRLNEDKKALEEYKRAVGHLTESEQSKKIEDFKKSLYSYSDKPKPKKSSNPLAGLIRQKTSDTKKIEQLSNTATSSAKPGLVAYDSDDSDDDCVDDENENPPKKRCKS